MSFYFFCYVDATTFIIFMVTYFDNNAFNSCQEIWNSPYSNDSFPVYAEDIEAGGNAAPSYSMLSEAALSLKITIVGGSIPERSGDRLYNTCCVFGKEGTLKGKHRKVQVKSNFDIGCILS